MYMGNTVMQLAGCFRERLLRHHQCDASRESDLLERERHKERIRIARELRDTLLQTFFSASMRLCLADEWLPGDLAAKPILRRALDLIRKGLNEGRATLLGLRSPVLSGGSLEKALCDARNDFAPSEHLQVRIVIIGEAKPVEPAVQEQILWVAREALLNALRHSKASSVEVEIEYLRRKLRVLVRDNGIGINAEELMSAKSLHWGLTAMRERAASIGAEVHVWSEQGQGTEVGISVPIRRVQPLT